MPKQNQEKKTDSSRESDAQNSHSSSEETKLDVLYTPRQKKKFQDTCVLPALHEDFITLMDA